MQDRTSAARPIAIAHVQSYDHLITRAILSHYLATLAFIVQQSHINARPIARFNAFASQYGRFRSCDRCATTFSYAIFSATVYDPNLNFLIAWLFARFWSCTNCERSLSCKANLSIIQGLTFMLKRVSEDGTLKWNAFLQFYCWI